MTSRDPGESKCARKRNVDWGERARMVGMSAQEVEYPEGWEFPGQNAFQCYHTKSNFNEARQQLSSRPFNGTREDYARFRNIFKYDLHVQNKPVGLKVSALDACVSYEVYQTHFQGLTSSATDYATKPQRLENTYRGKWRYLEYLVDRLKALGYG